MPSCHDIIADERMHHSCGGQATTRMMPMQRMTASLSNHEWATSSNRSRAQYVFMPCRAPECILQRSLFAIHGSIHDIWVPAHFLRSKLECEALFFNSLH